LSEERWRAVFENSGVGIALTDPNGAFIATNRAYQQMVGYTDEELRTLSYSDITYKEDWDSNSVQVTELLGGKRQQFQIEKRYRRKDGSLIWVRNTVSLTPGSGTVPRFAMAIVEDITERKRAQFTVQSLMRISQRLNSTLDLDALMDSLILEATMLTDSEIGWVGLRTERGMICTRCVRDGEIIPFEYCWRRGSDGPGGSWFTKCRTCRMTRRPMVSSSPKFGSVSE